MINKEKLQQALIIVYNNDVLVPKIDYDWGTFKVEYTYCDLHYCVMLPRIDIENSNITLEQITHAMKSHIVAQIEDCEYYDH